MRRSSGILMPISSLPTPYGIGTLGKSAYEFVDFLNDAGQSYWQILPVGSLSYGNSPYQSFSTYAGNPYFIDLDMLVEKGLLENKDIKDIDWGENPEAVDYGKIFENRFPVLAKAAEKGLEAADQTFADFIESNKDWLEDYALFMALKKFYDMKPWYEWPEDIRLRKADAILEMEQKLEKEIQIEKFIQYLFFDQWNRLKMYAVKHGIQIIGDIPIYVAMDSADVWAEPNWFLLDEKNVPIAISGVPPDSFNADGQLWGNPLYRWDLMEKSGFAWWIKRIRGALKLYDVIRIDHFRGLASYWSVPYGEKTAMNGQWVMGPGKGFIDILKEEFKDAEFIAEDLGYLTEEVYELLDYSGFPGMKILEFAFDTREAGNYMPDTYCENSVCYTGTHDNAPLVAWKAEADKADIAEACAYYQISEEDNFNWSLIEGGMSTVSNLFVVQMQDYLELGADARINVPGVPDGNWQWRMQTGVDLASLSKKINELTKKYNR